MKAALSSSSYETTTECAELRAETMGAPPACVMKGISCGPNWPGFHWVLENTTIDDSFCRVGLHGHIPGLETWQFDPSAV